MQVIIDIGQDGSVHFIETDPANYMKVQHPDGVSGLVGVDVMLQFHNQTPAARTAGGWDVMNQLHGESAPISRWDRLVAACNGPEGTAQAKGLGLKQSGGV